MVIWIKFQTNWKMYVEVTRRISFFLGFVLIEYAYFFDSIA